MSLEAQLAELTAAVKENTEAQMKLAAAATAAVSPRKADATPGTAKPAEKEETPETPEEDDAEAKKKAAAEKRKETAAKKKAEKEAAEKKAAAEKAAEKSETEAPELSATVEMDDFKKQARAFMSPDDEEERDANKEKFAAALKHLGAGSLSKVDDDDLPRLAGYVTYWQAGLDVDFEAVDEIVAGLSDEGDGEDMLA